MILPAFFCGGNSMRKTAFLLALFATIILQCGCLPENSLFALSTTTDKVFEESLIGHWNMQEVAGSNSTKKLIPLFLQKGGDGYSYNLTLINYDGEGTNLVSSARLVLLDKFLFIDLGNPDSDQMKVTQIPYPSLTGHVFGIVHLEKDFVRIDFLNDEWVEKQAKAGTLELKYVESPDGIILAAKTEDLRTFALHHAEDKNAFSQSYVLTPEK